MTPPPDLKNGTAQLGQPRPLAILPDPILRQKAQPVAAMDDATLKLMADMVATMRAEDGLGLAAPQVGVLSQVIVMQCSDDDRPANGSTYTPNNFLGDYAPTAPSKLWKMANPHIIAHSPDTSTWEEGCLSIPDVKAKVTRPAWVKVGYLSEHGQSEEMEATGLLAACVQHEIDHLNGRLFIDYLSQAKRDMIIRKFSKAARKTQSVA